MSWFELIPLIGTIGGFVITGYAIWAVTRSRQFRVEKQTELQMRLIERFGSAPELISFLDSAAGQRFMGNIQAAPRYITRERIIGGFRRSIIVSTLGLAFIVLGMVFEAWIAFPGVLLLAIGGGYLGATYVSMRLSDRMGLTHEDAPRVTLPPSAPADDVSARI